jgi:hypothetical protein
MTSDRILEADFDEMGRRWFGLGNLRGSCWFVGMEPSGTEDPAWPSEWATKFGAAPVVDLAECSGDENRRWLGEYNVMHPTWSPLIRARLAYAGLPADDRSVLAYQRETFCRAEGGEALLELSAYAAKDLDAEVPRERYIDERIADLRAMMAEYRPEIVVCYGATYRAYFNDLCGGDFDDEGFRWSGDTLCALVPHPKPRFRAPQPGETWISLGAELRSRVREGRSAAA